MFKSGMVMFGKPGGGRETRGGGDDWKGLKAQIIINCCLSIRELVTFEVEEVLEMDLMELEVVKDISFKEGGEVVCKECGENVKKMKFEDDDYKDKDDRVTVQNVQVRWSKGYGVNTGKGKATGTWVINTVGDVQANQPRVIRCYSYKGKGYITKMCTAKKRVKDLEWFKEKMLLAQAQESWSYLHKSNKIFWLIGSINGDTVGPTYDLDILSKVPYYDTYHEADVLNPVVLETKYSEHLVSNNDSYDELTSDRNVISYADYIVINAMILYVIEQMQSQVEQCNTVNLENRMVNESLTSELERYKEKVKDLEERQKSKHFFMKQEENLDSQMRGIL
ncbi:hypothetical protein Tco_0505205 [Tanacetum coccineum]